MAGDALVRRLMPLFDDDGTTTKVALAAVVEAYNEEVGQVLDAAALTPGQRHDLREWLYKLMFGEEPVAANCASLMYRRRRLEHLPLFADMGSKVNWLAQHRCAVCRIVAPPRMFPIEVPPWSHQSAPYIGPALRRAIDANPTYREHYKPVPRDIGICLRFVFVLGEGASMKDCDNMAKGLADAFQGLLYEDDRQVEHMDLLKLFGTQSPSGYILVSCSGTGLNDHGDTIDPRHARIGWMDATSLNLHDFLPPPLDL